MEDNKMTLAELVQLINDSEADIARAESARVRLTENLPAYWSALRVAYFDDGMSLKAIGELASPARSDDSINADLAHAMLAHIRPNDGADQIRDRLKGMNNPGKPTGAQVKEALGLPRRSKKWKNIPKAADGTRAIVELFEGVKTVAPTGKTAKALKEGKAKAGDMPKPGAKSADPAEVLARALADYRKACPDYDVFRKNVAVMVAGYAPKTEPAKVNA